MYSRQTQRRRAHNVFVAVNEIAHILKLLEFGIAAAERKTLALLGRPLPIRQSQSKGLHDAIDGRVLCRNPLVNELSEKERTLPQVHIILQMVPWSSASLVLRINR